MSEQPRCHGEGEIEVGTVRDEFGTWDTETFKCPGCPDCRTLRGLVSEIVAACTDSDPRPFDETDGLDGEVASLIVEYLQAGDARLAALLGLDEEADDGDIAAEIERLRGLGAERDILRQKIEWVLTDAVYTPPEDHERRARQYYVLRNALSDTESPTPSPPSGARRTG